MQEQIAIPQAQSSNEQKLHSEEFPNHGIHPNAGAGVGTDHDFDVEDVPITWKTYLVIFTCMLFQVQQIFYLLASAFVSSYVTAEIGSASLTNWIPIMPNLGQSTLSPALAFASDKFGSRKWFILVPTILSIAGAMIAGSAKSFGVLVVGQVLAGGSVTTVPLIYAIPSEILPRNQRAFAQAAVNSGASIGQVLGTLISGALLAGLGPSGWRWSFYIGGILAGVCATLLFLVYNPAPRPKPPPSTLRQKIHMLDAVGSFLFTAGLLLLIAGISEGDNPAPWASSKPIGLMVAGFVTLGIFGAWEWHRKDGIMSAELFSSRDFALSVIIIFLEGMIFFSYYVFYPAEQNEVWETRPLYVALRTIPFPLVALLGQLPLGYLCTKYRSIKIPLIIGFVIYTLGFIGLAVTNSRTGPAVVAASATAGLGSVPIIVLVVVIAQLATPSHLIGTSTAIVACSRAVGSSVGTAIYGSILRSKISALIPARVPEALIRAGLPPTSVGPFLGALGSGNIAALARVPGATPQIIETGVAAFKSALAKAFTYVWWTTIPFAAVGAILTFCLRNQSAKMVGIVDAPFEGAEKQHELRSNGKGNDVREINSKDI